jgi:hypothetical protein
MIAAFFTLLMLVATVLAGMELSAGLATPAPATAPVPVERAVAETDANLALEATALVWPALFGEPLPPAPPPAPAQVTQEAQPPTPPKPALGSLGFELKGLVRAGGAVWGLVSHPTGEKIMRVGDTLTDGVTISRIDEQGLWVVRGDDPPELLGFVE